MSDQGKSMQALRKSRPDLVEATLGTDDDLHMGQQVSQAYRSEMLSEWRQRVIRLLDQFTGLEKKVDDLTSRLDRLERAIDNRDLLGTIATLRRRCESIEAKYLQLARADVDRRERPAGTTGGNDRQRRTAELAIAAARMSLNLLAKISRDPEEVAAITDELNDLIDPLESEEETHA